MSILSRAAEAVVPLTVACAQVGYPTDPSGQRNLRRQLRRKGFQAQRLGNHFSIQVATWQAYLKRCAEDQAAHRAKISAQAKARWAASRQADDSTPK
jgi:hypothetical protein